MLMIVIHIYKDEGRRHYLYVVIYSFLSNKQDTTSLLGFSRNFIPFDFKMIYYMAFDCHTHSQKHSTYTLCLCGHI